MQTHAKKNKVNHQDKIECVFRIKHHGSTIPACAKRFGVTDKKVKSWLSMHEKGELIKQHAHWSPSWNKENIQVVAFIFNRDPNSYEVIQANTAFIE